MPFRVIWSKTLVFNRLVDFFHVQESKTMLKRWPLLSLLALSVACTTTNAQDLRLEKREVRKVSSDAPESEVTFMTSELIGLVVKDKADRSLGEVKDLVMNARGEVLYLAVLPENENGNEEYSLIPYSALNLADSSEQKVSYVTTVIEYDRFVEAPLFARDAIYTGLAGAQIFRDVNSFWGIQGPRRGFGFNPGTGIRNQSNFRSNSQSETNASSRQSGPESSASESSRSSESNSSQNTDPEKSGSNNSQSQENTSTQPKEQNQSSGNQAGSSGGSEEPQASGSANGSASGNGSTENGGSAEASGNASGSGNGSTGEPETTGSNGSASGSGSAPGNSGSAGASGTASGSGSTGGSNPSSGSGASGSQGGNGQPE